MTWFELVPILYLFISNSLYLALLVSGFFNSRRTYAEHQLELVETLGPLRGLPAVSILVPAYNEEKSIVESVRSMLRIRYPEHEVIVVNDGSTDRTLGELIEAFQLFSCLMSPPRELPCSAIKTVYRSSQFDNLVVVDKQNGGKSDALNAAINVSQYPLVCCVDADSIIESDGLISVAMPFFEDMAHTCAVGGVVRVANGSCVEEGRVKQTGISWNWLAMIQVAEYLRSFLAGRMGWDFFGCNLIISGAFGLFRRDVVVSVGGYSTKTVGEDFELLLRIRRYCLESEKPYRVRFFSNPVCWTETPKDLISLGNQRARWAQGLAETLWTHKRLLFRRSSGFLGWVGLPYLWVFELLSAPVEFVATVIILGGAIVGSVNSNVVCLFLSSWLLYGWGLTLFALLIEETTFSRYQEPLDLAKIILGSFLEQVGFRQLHTLWRLRGLYRFFRKEKSWGEIQRAGFHSLSPELLR